MAETDIGNTVASDLTTEITAYSVDKLNTDGVGGSKETTWQQNNWSQYFGYYNEIPELNSTIDARATWTVGKGIVAGTIEKPDPDTQFVMDQIKGYGKDTFNTIIENMIRTMWIGGDSYAEIIRDEDRNLINLKPLDTGAMIIVVDDKGLIKRYEQASKTKDGENKKFQPEEIFHLVRNRVADQIHGTSVITKLEQIILMRNEAMTSYKEVMQRFMKPRYIFHLDTDDPTKIAGFKTKMDKAWADGENIYIPKGAVVPELMSVSPNSTLNPQAWIDSLNDYFYEACATPKIIVGNSKNFTEASAKIVYLAFQQSVEEDQTYIEEQVGMQLGMEIDLIFPASLENELLSDKAKDGPMTAAQPNDTTVAPVEDQIVEETQ